MFKTKTLAVSLLIAALAFTMLGSVSAAPPDQPSSFYGGLYFHDGAPDIGATVEAYVPGRDTPVATTHVFANPSSQPVYAINVPGDDPLTLDVKEGGVEGGQVIFRIAGRVVAIGTWHQGTNVQLDFHPPQAVPGGPYSGDEGSLISFSGSANDYGSDATTYEWDWNNDGTYDATGQAPSHTWLDNGIYTVVLSVTDTQGGQGTATVQVTVYNVAPTATLSNNGPVNEGSPATISFSNQYDPSTADTSAGFHYAFSCTNGDLSGATYTGSGTSASTDCTYDDNGVYTVKARIIDKDNGFTEYTTNVTVNNVAPTATLSNNGPVNEGSPATISFTGQSDPSTADTTAGFHYAFSCTNGDLSGATYTGSGTSASTDCTYDDNGVYTVKARIIDKDNGFTEYTTNVTVNNVAPSATFNAPASVDEGSDIVLSLTSPSDPSSADTTAGFQYAFDCGGGGGYGPWSSTSTETCPTTDNGSLTVRGKIRDKDLGEREYTAVVTVNDVLPIAEAGGPYPGIAGQPVTLSGTPTCVLVDACTVAWYYGAIQIGTTNSVNYTWNNAGTYTVQFQVTDNDGNTVPDNATVTIAPATQSISLVAGWNLVSFRLIPSDPDPALVLASLGTSYDLVYAWDATGGHSGGGNWEKFDRTVPFGSTLTALDEKRGFWIHMTAAAVLTVQGNVPTTTIIPLATTAGGWNLVGYPSPVTRALPGAMGSAPFTLIYAYHAGDTLDPWKLYDNSPTAPPWASDLTTLGEGWGYWAYVTAPYDWSVQY